MVRKISIFLCAFALIMAFAMPAHGADYTVYNGSISTTYLTYMKDLYNGIDFGPFERREYVAFRSGQYEYTLAVGPLDISYGEIYFDGNENEYLAIYTITTSNSFNDNNLTITEEFTQDFELIFDDLFVYASASSYPSLEEKGTIYEYQISFILCIFFVCYIVSRVFYFRKR